MSSTPRRFPAARWWRIGAGCAALAVLATCFPSLTSAPCPSADGCPRGQVCGPDGACVGGAGGGAGACLDGQGNPIDLLTSLENCGTCGHVCPTPVRATATCAAGSCGRSSCQAGFFDLDGPATFGCESTCIGRTCSYPDGGTITASNVPLHEDGLVGRSLQRGSAWGAGVQTSATHSNFGSIGEATPLTGGGM